MKTKNYVFSSLGKLIVSFQHLEQTIERLMFCSMTLDYSQFSIVSSEMSFQSKVNTACALLKGLHKADEDLVGIGNIHKFVDHIRKQCTNCSERRNQLVHSSWIPEFRSSPDLVMRIKKSSKAKSGYKYSVETFEKETLEKDITLIEETTKEVGDFCETLAVQYRRIHGISGLGTHFDHKMLTEVIYNTFMDMYGGEKRGAT